MSVTVMLVLSEIVSFKGQLAVEIVLRFTVPPPISTVPAAMYLLFLGVLPSESSAPPELRT